MNRLKILNYCLLTLSITFSVFYVIFTLVASEYDDFKLFLILMAAVSSLLLAFINKKYLICFLVENRSKKYFSNFITCALTLLILFMINFLIVKNDLGFDLTRNKIHTLSKKSLQLIKKLDGEKTLFTLYVKKQDWNTYINLLNLYKRESKDIEIQLIDVEKEAALVSLKNVTTSGTLFLSRGEKTVRGVVVNELDISKLINKLFNQQELKVFYTSGHEEDHFDDKTDLGLSYLKETIIDSNYDLKETNLLQDNLTAANMLLILNPKNDFLDSEIEVVKNYLESGGRVILTLAPSLKKSRTTKLELFLANYGLIYKHSIVLDRLSAGQGGQPSIPIINTYNSHEIVKDFSGRTFFPISGHLVEKKSKLELEAEWQPVIKTTPFPATWAETSFEQIKSGKAIFNDETDTKGPLTIGMTSQIGPGKLIVFSSANFLFNQMQGQSTNFNLFLNSINWGLGQKDLISLDRPNIKGSIVYISDIHLSLMFFIIAILFPFVFFIWAIVLYRKKMSA